MLVCTSLRAEVDLWCGDFWSPPPPELVGLVGVSKIMLARKLSSMLAPPGVPLLLRETGTEPGGVETERGEQNGMEHGRTTGGMEWGNNNVNASRKN